MGMHKGMVGRVPTTEDNGPGTAFRSEHTLSDYLNKKYKHDAFVAVAAEKKKLSFEEWYQQRLIDFDGQHPSASVIWNAAQDNMTKEN